MSCSYAVLRDFAGPIATVVAAIVVVGVTWRFSSQQAKTARGQLRLNLFDKRYAVYKDIQQHLKVYLDGAPRSWLAAELFKSLDEAAFLFSPATCKWLQTVRDDTQASIADMGTGFDPDLKTKLREHLGAMPKHFHDDLSLSQLTSD
jgi:hypothetical protein